MRSRTEPMILEVRYIGVRSAMVKAFQIGAIFSLIIVPPMTLLLSHIISGGVIIISATHLIAAFVYYLFICTLIGSIFATITGAITYTYNLTCRWWGGGVEIILAKSPDQRSRTPAD